MLGVGRLLAYLALEGWSIVDALEVLTLEVRIVVNLLTSKLVLMNKIPLLTLVIDDIVGASALHQVWLGQAELGFVRTLHVVDLLCTHLEAGVVLECGRGAHLGHKAWLE